MAERKPRMVETSMCVDAVSSPEWRVDSPLVATLGHRKESSVRMSAI